VTAGAPRARRRGSAPPGSARRLVAGSAALLVAAAAGLVVAAPAAEAAACSGSSGVTVVVDFGSLGGGVQTGCAGGDPASGLAALSAAGHGYTFVPRQFGLVCQIDARPNPCNGAPTTAYWSYWHATRGGSWSYATAGAGGYNPQPGTVEGWAFGAGGRPGIAPPAAPAPPPPAPKPTTKPAPRPSAQPPPAPAPPRGSAAAGGEARGGAPGSAAGSTSRSPARTTTAPSTSAGPTPTDGTSPSPTGAAGAPSTSDSGFTAVVAVQRPPPPRYPWKRLLGSALAIVLIVGIAATGILVARRRRSQPPM
jgi:hypothetical protein